MIAKEPANRGCFSTVTGTNNDEAFVLQILLIHRNAIRDGNEYIGIKIGLTHALHHRLHKAVGYFIILMVLFILKSQVLKKRC